MFCVRVTEMNDQKEPSIVNRAEKMLDEIRSPKRNLGHTSSTSRDTEDIGDTNGTKSKIPTLEEQPQNDSDNVTIKRLAKLSSLDYDRVRKEEAERLGVRVEILDKAVRAEKSDQVKASAGFHDVEPWSDAINPVELLNEISFVVRRFIICSKEVADAVALWVAMTWLIDVVQVAPLVVITAPEKRCGKTQLLTILLKLCYRSLSASNISPAALFRCIESWQPTLLLDETDTFLKENEALRGIINSGHSRDNAYVIRTVGDDHIPQRFNTFGAKALSGIGHLPDTLRDRAIILELRRKLGHESVDRLRYAEPNLFEILTRKLARFATDYREAVRLVRPHLPEQLNDRAQDNWEPMLAIADVAGGEWPKRARIAALKISEIDDSASVGNELLADIKEIFEDKNLDRISTQDLIAALISDDMKSWATYNRGRQLTPRQLAARLKSFGIKPETIRTCSGTPKGYKREQFKDAFERYLTTSSPPSLDLSATTQQFNSDADSRVAHAISDVLGNRNTQQIDIKNVAENHSSAGKKVRI